MALLKRNRMSISALARQINRPRPTVSVAINQDRFREVRAQIEQALNLR